MTTATDTLDGMVRRRMIVLALFAALIRPWVPAGSDCSDDLGPADLQRFESLSGVDLPDAYGDLPFFLLWTRGDGQAYVTLASDLDLQGPAQRLLLPSYRYTRVGYAWMGRVFALGRVDLIPVGLMLVNLTALAGIGALTAKLVQLYGERSYLLLLNPGLYVGFATDTAEPLGLLLLIVGPALRVGSARRSGERGVGNCATEFWARITGPRAQPWCASAGWWDGCAAHTLDRTVRHHRPHHPDRDPRRAGDRLPGYLQDRGTRRWWPVLHYS